MKLCIAFSVISALFDRFGPFWGHFGKHFLCMCVSFAAGRRSFIWPLSAPCSLLLRRAPAPCSSVTHMLEAVHVDDVVHVDEALHADEAVHIFNVVRNTADFLVFGLHQLSSSERSDDAAASACKVPSHASIVRPLYCGDSLPLPAVSTYTKVRQYVSKCDQWLQRTSLGLMRTHAQHKAIEFRVCGPFLSPQSVHQCLWPLARCCNQPSCRIIWSVFKTFTRINRREAPAAALK